MCLTCFSAQSQSSYGERSGSVVECLTRERGAAGSSLTVVTVLCPWARHINPSLVLVQRKKTRPFITEILLMRRKESSKKIQKNRAYIFKYSLNLANSIKCLSIKWLVLSVFLFVLFVCLLLLLLGSCLEYSSYFPFSNCSHLFLLLLSCDCLCLILTVQCVLWSVVVSFPTHTQEVMDTNLYFSSLLLALLP